ncbi:MAG: nucleoside 2-deoxyribosyltransferase domain-containing protein [Chloroflexota bacterium]
MTNHVLVAPERRAFEGPSVFLAGGITNSPRWQDDVINYLTATLDGITIFNPRRPNDFGDVTVEYERQVIWELDHIFAADLVLFWFPAAECRITRIEFGLVVGHNKPVVVGADPQFVNYHYLTLLTQRYNLPLYDQFDALLAATQVWLTNKQASY